MFKLTALCRQPLLEIPAIEGARGGGLWHRRLKLSLGFANLDLLNSTALLVLSDLQGRSPILFGDSGSKLVVEELVDRCRQLDTYIPLYRDETMVFLCGDLFASTNLLQRGQSGCALLTWQYCTTIARTVIGIGGNHDHFCASPHSLRDQGAFFLEHGACVQAGSLRIAGYGGMIGNTKKPFRYSEETYLKDISSALNQKPDILLLHQGPDLPGAFFTGNSKINEILQKHENPLTLFYGHIGSSIVFTRYGRVDCFNVDSNPMLVLPESRISEFNHLHPCHILNNNSNTLINC